VVVGEPKAVEVPAALRARVPMLELSGLVWAPALDRYLVVVDDSVDDETGARHAPFALALDRAGRLDADPVPIDGVDEVDDAEALAAGPEGTFFLLTSHAPNRRGRLARARRQLLELRLEGRRLRVRGGLDLLHGHGDVLRRLEKLGFPLGTPVDLEALAFHDGALYIGLKSPLLTDGSAIILRLDRPAEAFALGALPRKSLSFWAEVKLAVPAAGAAGANVPQGLAELLFTPDGALYLCGNAPKHAAPDGGGALWRVSHPHEGRLEAALVRRFVGLKPEGLAVAPGGRALTVVFDRDVRDPLWFTWPLGQ
jgi:hypothetical protein